MRYAKPALSPEQQADLLIRRGMRGDRALMIERLRMVSYYRLTGYWHPFREADERFADGTDFETVWRRYVFDRRLRLLVMDAVERIEVAVRSQLAFEHAHKYGDPFAYAETSTSLPNITSDRRSEFLGKIRTEKIRSHETFVRHFTNRYGDTHGYLPVWMAAEIMSFGGVLTFYNGCEEDIKQKLASTFGIPALVLGSWMLTLNTVRNICAHHGRLWNRVLGTTPLIPRVNRYPDWHRPYSVPNNRTFVVLTICRYSLGKVAPQSRWAERLKDLLNEFPDIPIRDMGFPENWIESPIWNNV